MCKDRWVDAWQQLTTNRWMDRWKDGGMDKWIDNRLLDGQIDEQ